MAWRPRAIRRTRAVRLTRRCRGSATTTMLDSLSPPPVAPFSGGDVSGSVSPAWPEADRRGLRWIEEPRRHAPGLDSLLTWAFRASASRVSFQTGHPVWVGIHGHNHRLTRTPIDEIEFSHIVNHLYGADGMARLQGGNDFDTAYAIAISRSTRLRFRVNATPTRTSRRDGGNLVLRPIPDMPPSLAQQGVEPAILEACRPRQGMVIVAGATGSPSRWGRCRPHPSQTRTCGFPASGSSRERFARGSVG